MGTAGLQGCIQLVQQQCKCISPRSGSCMHAGRGAEWDGTGLQGSGCWSPRTDAHQVSQPVKAPWLLGQQPLPDPLAPTSSTHSYLQTRHPTDMSYIGPEPQTQGQGGLSTPSTPLGPSPE